MANTQADWLSRATVATVAQGEWSLDPDLFREITARLGVPVVDLFATQTNCQTVRFFSWFPEPGMEAVDALLSDWPLGLLYAFPPSAPDLQSHQEPAPGAGVTPSDRPPMALPTVVRRPASLVSAPPMVSSTRQGHPSTRGSSTSGCQLVAANCLEIEPHLLSDRRLPSRVISTIQAVRRPSTT